ncbi:putative reverse transcriptase domain-containing protein [Tanacetum coccineum]
MSKVLQERGFGSLPSSTETNLRDQVKSISTTIEADSHSICRIGIILIRQEEVNHGSKFTEAYGASHINNTIPRKEKDPRSFTLPCFINDVCFDNALVDLGASISVMPLSTYLNLGLGKLAHTRLTVELADRTMKYPKRIAENVLVGISKFTFPITLRVGEERIIFTSVKPASSLIKMVYMLSLRERMELDLEARLMGETLVLNRSLDPFFEDYIEVNDLNEPFELRRNQRDDLILIDLNSLQVMEAPVIFISLDVSVESVGSSFPRVILIGSISVEVPVTPNVGVAAVALPARDDSESYTKIPERHVSPTPHDAMLTRWRSRIASRSSSPTTSSPEIPTAPILPAPSAVVKPSSESLTMRKSVRPLPSHRLALRYTSHHLDRFTIGSSSGHSSLDHSSSGHSILGHSLSRHASPNTTVTDSSTTPRFVYLPLARTPWCTEAYLCWRSAPLSTMYPPTTSESSAGDSSFESSARPSRKRCRSPAITMTSSIHATRALVPSRVDLLPPRKRFKDSILSEDSVKEDIDTDVLVDIKADAMANEVVVDKDVKAGVDTGIGMEVNVGVDVEDEVEDEVESSDRGTMEVGVDMVARINIPDGMLMPDAVECLEQVEEERELESKSLVTGGERASLLKQVASLERRNVRLRGTMMMQRARSDRFWRCVSFTESELRQIRWFCYYDRMRFRRLETFANMTITCSVKAKTAVMAIMEMVEIEMVEMEMVGMEMVKMEMAEMNIQMRIIGVLGPLLESNNDLAAYTQRFQELTMMCTKMVPEEEDRVEKFIGGLPDDIQGNVIVFELTKLQDAIRIANNLMDQKLKG